MTKPASATRTPAYERVVAAIWGEGWDEDMRHELALDGYCHHCGNWQGLLRVPRQRRITVECSNPNCRAITSRTEDCSTPCPWCGREVVERKEMQHGQD